MTVPPPSGGFQEKLWRGQFGDSYIERNAVDAARLAARTATWAEILKTIIGAPPESILEVGSNIGLNLRAIRRLSAAAFYALEPNEKARSILIDEGVVDRDKALDGISTKIPLPDASVDLAFTAGVLIHVHPDQLLQSCREIHRVSKKYVVCIEYFSDKPEEIPYRGHTEALFKRDFGSFYLDNFPDLRIVDYGFFWNRTTGLDNLTWWVFDRQK